MSQTQNIQEQLTYKLGLQIILIIAAIAFTALYTLPKLETANANIEQANLALEEFKNISENGIAKDKLISNIQSIGNDSELVEIVKEAWNDITPIITKTDNSKPYLTWLKENSISNENDIQKFSDGQAKINSIIPTISPISHNRNTESITLREYITFIEKEILAKYNIESLSPLGIESVKYDEQDGSLKNPVGEMKVDINFKTANRNIIELLDFLHKSWEPSILSSQEIFPVAPAIMSNPLVVVDEFSSNRIIDPENPYVENSGRISLKFYVRGSSSTDTNYLIESFTKRKNTLKEEISQKTQECRKDNCISLEAYETIEKKMTGFDKGLEAVIKSDKSSIETAYIIGQQLQSLQTLRTEFENIK